MEIRPMPPNAVALRDQLNAAIRDEKAASAKRPRWLYRRRVRRATAARVELQRATSMTDFG